MGPLKPQGFIAIGVLVLVGLSGWYVQVQRAQERSVLSGFFESRQTQVSSRVGGRVSRILVDEGTVVHKGQPLIKIEASPARDLALAKEAAAEQSLANLKEVKNGPRPQDIEAQKAAVAEAQANLTLLENGPRPQEVAEARAAERAAYAHLAAAERGPTTKEKQEDRARLDAALFQEWLARRDAARYQSLFAVDAVTRQQNDEKQANLQGAIANRQAMQETWRRDEEGTPKEELEEARQSYLQSKSALDLVLAGSRPEDIEGARARLAQAEARLTELREGSRQEDVAQAQAAALAARANAQSSMAEIAERIVCAPYDGVVDNIPVAVGDLVNPGTPLVRLDNPTDIWIRVYVPESQLANVTAGASADLRIDGVADPIPAFVESVASQGEFTPANLQSPEERGKQVFAVFLRLTHPDLRVKAGMDATVIRIGKWMP